MGWDIGPAGQFLGGNIRADNLEATRRALNSPLDFKSVLGLVNLHRVELICCLKAVGMGYACANDDTHQAIGNVQDRLI